MKFNGQPIWGHFICQFKSFLYWLLVLFLFDLTVFIFLSTQTVALTPETLFSRPVEHLVLWTFQTQLTQFDTLIESIIIPFLFILNVSTIVSFYKFNLCNIRTDICLFLCICLRLCGMQSRAIMSPHGENITVIGLTNVNCEIRKQHQLRGPL